MLKFGCKSLIYINIRKTQNVEKSEVFSIIGLNELRIRLVDSTHLAINLYWKKIVLQFFHCFPQTVMKHSVLEIPLVSFNDLTEKTFLF